jgi:hypothetical protein
VKINFWELFEKELKELKERKIRKMINNGVCMYCVQQNCNRIGAFGGNLSFPFGQVVSLPRLTAGTFGQSWSCSAQSPYPRLAKCRKQPECYAKCQLTLF